MKSNRLAQIYDAEIDDGSGRLETRYAITAASVRRRIAQHQAANDGRVAQCM